MFYAPEIIDAVGNKVKGELHIENGILSVTIPQDFLDTAVYPVRHAAGLTFGFTTCGATAGGWAADQTVGARNGPAISSTGNITDINVCMATDGNGTSHIKGFITTTAYAIVANSITSGQLINAPSSGTWNKITYSGPSVTSGTTYYPWIIADGNWSEMHNAGGSRAFKLTSESYASPSDPTSPTVQSYSSSIYATYQAASSGATPPALIIFE
jgi:hypothetical protein